MVAPFCTGIAQYKSRRTMQHRRHRPNMRFYFFVMKGLLSNGYYCGVRRVQHSHNNTRGVHDEDRPGTNAPIVNSSGACRGCWISRLTCRIPCCVVWALRPAQHIRWSPVIIESRPRPNRKKQAVPRTARKLRVVIHEDGNILSRPRKHVFIRKHEPPKHTGHKQ